MTAYTDAQATNALIAEALDRIRAARRELANAVVMIEYVIGETPDTPPEVSLDGATIT